MESASEALSFHHRWRGSYANRDQQPKDEEAAQPCGAEALNAGRHRTGAFRQSIMEAGLEASNEIDTKTATADADFERVPESTKLDESSRVGFQGLSALVGRFGSDERTSASA